MLTLSLLLALNAPAVMLVTDPAGYAGWQAARYAGAGFVSHMPGLRRHNKPVVCNAYACSPVAGADQRYSASGDCSRGKGR